MISIAKQSRTTHWAVAFNLEETHQLSSGGARQNQEAFHQLQSSSKICSAGIDAYPRSWTARNIGCFIFFQTRTYENGYTCLTHVGGLCAHQPFLSVL